ncbi:MAG: immune inhibitor A, partial [Candidatus Cloacimonetes bacterium]|nr:immune inhibitor A [Candidatus Cloacimonadota bacterium]
MKAKIFIITIITILISISFSFAAKKNDAVPDEKLMIVPTHTPYHPVLENPPEKIYPIRSDELGLRDPPAPDQDVYFLWEDNFEDEDAIWYYANASYFWVIPDEADEYGVRFTARRAGTLEGAWFYWYSGCVDAEAVVHVYADDGTGYPGAELGSVTVTAVLGAWNYVDLTTLGLSVTTTDDFFITYSVVPGDTLSVVSDDGPSGANRSVEILPGSGTWSYTIDDWDMDYEWCIDAVIGVIQEPWVSSPADRWQLVDDDYNSPIHSWWIDDNSDWPGMNWLTSPAFICPDGYVQLELSFFYNSDFLDGAYSDDDWWSFYIGRTADAIAWHSSEYNAYLDSTSWYAGSENTNQYGTNTIYYLYTPDIDLTSASTAQLTCVIDYDMEEPGGEDPPYDGWDVATVQISTDGWLTKGFLEDPDHPYNVTIAFAGYWNTNNPADTISYPGWGGANPDGWFEANFDLSDYIGEIVQIRFALASDPYNVAEGYWVDNVDVTGDGDIVFSDYNETNLIPSDPIIPYEELECSNLADELVSDGWVESEHYNVTLYQGYEFVLAARVKLDDDHSGGDGAGLWIDDVAIYGSNLPPIPDMANLFNLIPYPTTAHLDIYPGPGILCVNWGTTTEVLELYMDVEGLGVGDFDYYYATVWSGGYGIFWLTPV